MIAAALWARQFDEQPACAQTNDRPNIVFILADDLGWSDLACYGNPIHDTPNIDRLARSGMRFTQAYSPAPICSASRAAVLTGKTPARLHFEFVTKSEPGRQKLDVPLQSPPFTLNLPLAEVTMGDALSKAGYATAFFGKWHVSQHYKQYLGWSPTHGPLMQGFADGDRDFGSHPYAYRSNQRLKDSVLPRGEFPEDGLIEKATDFIHRRGGERFFLYLSHYYVHDPIHSRCPWLIEKYRRRLPSHERDERLARRRAAARDACLAPNRAVAGRGSLLCEPSFMTWSMRARPHSLLPDSDSLQPGKPQPVWRSCGAFGAR